jgi:5-methylcytosine-specific restriction protein A
MARAPKLCPHPGCIAFMPCPTHERKPWATTTPRTMSGWAQQRRARRSGAKHNTICHICHHPGATQADHVIPLAEGGPDTEQNMRPAHPDCHQAKTRQEAKRGRT